MRCPLCLSKLLDPGYPAGCQWCRGEGTVKPCRT